MSTPREGQVGRRRVAALRSACVMCFRRDDTEGTVANRDLGLGDGVDDELLSPSPPLPSPSTIADVTAASSRGADLIDVRPRHRRGVDMRPAHKLVGAGREGDDLQHHVMCHWTISSRYLRSRRCQASRRGARNRICRSPFHPNPQSCLRQMGFPTPPDPVPEPVPIHTALYIYSVTLHPLARTARLSPWIRHQPICVCVASLLVSAG